MHLKVQFLRWILSLLAAMKKNCKRTNLNQYALETVFLIENHTQNAIEKAISYMYTYTMDTIDKAGLHNVFLL